MSDKWNRIAAAVTAILAAAAVVSLAVPRGKRFAEKSFTTAYLSGELSKKIDTINFYSNGFSMTLAKKSGWIAHTSDGAAFPADESAINSFVATLTKIRQVSEGAKKAKSWESFGVGESAFVVEIFCGGDVPVRIYFGKTGMGSARIAFRTEKSVSTYQAENDIDVFLQTDPSFWCDPYLIAGAARESEGLQMVISGEAYTGARLEKIAAELMSLRRGLLCAANESAEASGAAARLDAVFLDGEEVALSFFKGDALYFVKSEIKSKELVYWYEISEWTFSNLQEIFTKADESATASKL